MDKVKILENKIKIVLGRLRELKDENERLAAEKNFLEEENKKFSGYIKENERLKEDKKLVKYKVEKLLKKLSIPAQQTF